MTLLHLGRKVRSRSTRLGLETALPGRIWATRPEALTPPSPIIGSRLLKAAAGPLSISIDGVPSWNGDKDGFVLHFWDQVMDYRITWKSVVLDALIGFAASCLAVGAMFGFGWDRDPRIFVAGTATLFLLAGVLHVRLQVCDGGRRQRKPPLLVGIVESRGPAEPIDRPTPAVEELRQPVAVGIADLVGAELLALVLKQATSEMIKRKAMEILAELRMEMTDDMFVTACHNGEMMDLEEVVSQLVEE